MAGHEVAPQDLQQSWQRYVEARTLREQQSEVEGEWQQQVETRIIMARHIADTVFAQVGYHQPNTEPLIGHNTHRTSHAFSLGRLEIADRDGRDHACAIVEDSRPVGVKTRTEFREFWLGTRIRIWKEPVIVDRVDHLAVVVSACRADMTERIPFDSANWYRSRTTSPGDLERLEQLFADVAASDAIRL